MRPLFIIGNKRSGTSQLVRLLNLHPEIFIAHEADALWILQRFHAGLTFEPHPWDSPRGMEHTLAHFRERLDPQRSPRENFATLLTAIMQNGTPWLPPADKKNLRWLGDKKPFQHTDPALQPFLREHFPDALYLHIVRHPAAVTASSDNFNRSRNGDFWLGLSPAEKIERWAFHERLAGEMAAALPGRVHRLRYEDLSCDTARELGAIFDFLEVTAAPKLLRQAARQTIPARRAYQATLASPEVLALASQYGYDLTQPASALRTLGEHWVWRMRKLFA